MKYIIDTYAWVEYFIGSEKGEILRELFLDQKNEFYTAECCLAEVKGWALRNNKDFNIFLKVVRSNSKIIQITEQDWLDSGEEIFEQRIKQKDFGLIDSLILVKQKQHNFKLVSGDKHFKNLKNVIFLG